MTTFAYPVFDQETDRIGQYYDWTSPSNPPGGFASRIVKDYRGEQFSEGHPRSPDGKYRQGGPWLEVKTTVDKFGPKAKTYRAGEGIAYDGEYVIATTFDYADLGNIPVLTKEQYDSQVLSYGAQAYAALKPDQPDFDALLSLLELKDLPDLLRSRFLNMFKKVRRVTPKGVRISRLSRFHLELQFGWKPLFLDTIKFVQAFQKRKKRFDQLLRDEGRGVRRRRVLSKTGNDRDWMTTSHTDYSGPSHPSMEPVHVTQCYGGAVAFSDTWRRHSTKVWCAGKSYYMLPKGPRDEKWKRNLLRKLSGLYYRPNVAYNLIPWSWLADYFSSLGSFFDAVSPGVADRCVFEYAYLMHYEDDHHKQYSEQGIYVTKTKTGRISAVRLKSAFRQSRIRATPLGFGLKNGDLSPLQWSILGAIGGSGL
jgi:hypothetical protein